MAGELWLGRTQMGLETVQGTEVTATRMMYYRDPVISLVRTPRVHKFATGTRDNVRQITHGPQIVGGTLVQPVSAEIIELLLIGLKGGVTGVGALADKVWTFTPGALASATLEWYDGARDWTVLGVQADSLKIAGSVSGENLVTASLFGTGMSVKAGAAGLVQGVPAVFEGWETALLIDAAGTAPTTAVTGTLLSWDVNFKNNLGRKYTAANTQAASAIISGEIEVEASLVFEAAAAGSATQFANWEAGTEIALGLRFGNNSIIGATASKETVQLNIPGKWAAADLGQTDEGTRAYQLTLNYIYNSTLAYSIQAVVTTARVTAWAART